MLKRYKSSGADQILLQTFQAGGNTCCGYEIPKINIVQIKGNPAT
jgi:hypothetical protein